MMKPIKITLPDEYGPNEEPDLLYIKHQILNVKSFISEVRGCLDVARFIKDAVILLDISETNLEVIIEKMLQKILEKHEPKCNISNVKQTFFLNHPDKVLARIIQGTNKMQVGTLYSDQSWVCSLCDLQAVKKHQVGIARLTQPANFGRNIQEVQFVILVISPINEKKTKNALETAKTFATIMANSHFRQLLLRVPTEDEFSQLILKRSIELSSELSIRPQLKLNSCESLDTNEDTSKKFKCGFARGLRQDFWRRLPYYLSDYTDGFRGHKTPHKVIATTFFLYFACLLPAIAFGVLNDINTNHAIGVKQVIFAQAAGGVFFALFCGQPLVILLTTAPIALFIKTIFNISQDFDLDFCGMYACVGLWNAFFIILYSLFDASYVMKWCSRSTEEIFSLFITIAFSLDAFSSTYGDFQKNYFAPGCSSNNSNNISWIQENNLTKEISGQTCFKENSLLSLLLMLGTLWLGLYLYNFTKSPFLNAGKREILADYALTVAVIVLSFVGSFLFRDIKVEQFYYADQSLFKLAPLHLLTIGEIFGGMGLGFLLSVLFFMDQNISSSMVNNPSNKLKKGPAYHLDLFIMAIINAVFSILGLPWIHAALPHSPLHVRALADTEVIVDEGHIHESIVYVRETRLTAIFSHILIGSSVFLLPYPIAYIPSAVLSGLFLYVAITALKGNELFDRILLLITEQAAYPPNHYIRRVPQRTIHIFTICQVLQLLVLCIIGFTPYSYVKMTFPIILLVFLFIRHYIIPKFIEDKYIQALDGH